MGLLAYDRSRLDSLRSALGAALDDLHGIRCDDAEAVDAARAVANACRTLDELCLPRVQAIFDSDPMSSYHKANVDGNDIRQALAYTMANTYGWEISSDQFDDNAMVVTPEQARALGFRLQNGRFNNLTNDPDEIAFVAQQLQVINSDPQLRAEFVANMTDLDKLAENFAAKRIDLVKRLLFEGVDPATSPTLTSIDATFAELAHLYQARPSTSHAGPYPAWTRDVEPFTAALLLRYAGLDPTTLGHVANDLLVRWQDADPKRWIDFDNRLGPHTADILFQLMLATPGASTVYVVEAAGNPASMWFSADDYRLAQQVALEGTDPANMNAADSGEVMKAFIDLSQSDRLQLAHYDQVGYPTDYTAFLGALVAPWLLQFSALNSDWSHGADLDYTVKEKLLKTVMSDHSAFKALIASHQAAVDGLLTSVQSSEDPAHVAKEYAALIGMLGQMIINQRVHDEEVRLAAWNMWWDVASLPMAWLPTLPSISADQIAGAAHDLVTAHGWLGAPTPDKVEAKAEWHLEWMLTMSGAAMAIAAFNQLGFPPGTPPPPEPDPAWPDPQLQYEIAFDEWQQAVDDPRTAAVDQRKSPFLNAADAGKSLVN